MDHRLAAALSVVDSEKTRNGYPLFIAESESPDIQFRLTRSYDAGEALAAREEAKRSEKKNAKPEHGVTYFPEPYLVGKDAKWPTREEWLAEQKLKQEALKV